MPSLLSSYESDDQTTSDTETSYVPRSPTSPLSPPGEPINMPQNPPAETAYNSSTMLYYMMNRIDEMSQQGGVSTEAVSQALAACHNRVDTLERHVPILQITRSEVHAVRIQNSRTTNIPPVNPHRQEMAAALTDQFKS